MRQEHLSITKISRPRLPKIFPRKRLFRLLDAEREVPVTWVSGPAGSGKTTLVASYLDASKLPCIWYQVDEGDADIASFFYYLGLAAKKAAPRYKHPLPLLTPEYALGIPTFTRNYFEQLCSRLNAPAVIVFDNFQEVPEASPFHDVVMNGLSVLPEGIRAMVISRAEPPQTFAGMIAGSKLHAIRWNELQLTLEESKGLVRFQGIDQSQSGLLDWMHEKTGGWAAGLVLLSRAIKTESIDPQTAGDLPAEKVFDYFANELFDRIDASTRDFLLKTALAPKITPHVAAELTGNKHAGQLLAELNQRNYFTEKRQQPELIYQYHALFREFLLTRAKKALGREDILRIQIQAASLFEGSGQIEDAAELCIEAQAWEGVIKLIMGHAPALMKQGRTATLGSWLAALPQELISRDPWLLYWSGACHMPFNPPESQASFEKAFHLFNTRKDAVGTFLSWAGVVNCIAYVMEDMTQFDHWIPVLNSLLKEYGAFPTKEVEGWVASAMIPALTLRQPDHPAFDSWKNKALLHEETKIHTLFQVAFYYTYRGDSLHAHQMRTALYRLANAPGASPLGLIMAKLFDTASHIFLSYDPHLCIQAAQEGLAIAEKSGVHIMDFMMLGNAVVTALSNGDLSLARSFLQKMAPSAEKRGAWDRVFYSFLLASEALFVKDLNKALRHAEEALRLVLQVGVRLSAVYCYYLNALVRYECGDVENANDLLEKGYRAAEVLGSVLTAHAYFFIKSYFDLGRGKTASAHASLMKAMAISREHGIFSIHPPIPPAIMFSVFAEALEAQIEVEYVRKLVRYLNIIPDIPPMHIENWPWPVKIHALGQFTLELDDKPVRFSGKVQKKPLDLLKVLIAFGGRDVSEERIIDALWPEAEGDAGRQAFKTNLHRLRQLVGNENALAYQDGRLSLDPGYCWVDAWAFERMAESAELKQLEPGMGVTTLEKAVAMYKGHFLTDDAEKPWAVSMRERLKDKFVKTMTALGEHQEGKKEYKKAVALYEKGLEVDDLAEELYQGLMSCHLELGRRADAGRVYERCRKNLAAAFGVGPSEETESLFRKIREN